MKRTRRVLVIEDDPWFAEQHERVLSRAGYSVVRARDGVAGMEKIDEIVPDVIVLDVFLPGPNAFVLLHEIQSHADLSILPILLCTSAEIEISPEAATSYGIKRILSKATMKPHDIVQAVEAVLV